MASILPGFEYDIFISYRQKDNKYDGWVTDFVSHLKLELEATFKEEISIYFDINPHDGLLETHEVDASLKEKLKCLIFIPVISQTYCDPKSFAWQYEFCAFNKLAKEDQFGRDIRLAVGNVASRILPVKIHDLDPEDKMLLENELGGVLRGIEFIYKSAGVNRPLRANEDHPGENLNKTYYRDQINKVANAVKEIINALRNPHQNYLEGPKEIIKAKAEPSKNPRTKILAVSLLFLALMISGYFFIPKPGSAKKRVEKSIAVLPFVNDSPDEANAYFINGVMDEILNNLQKIKDFRVLSRTSTEQFKGANKPTIPEIAKKLNVNYIVEGSGQKNGNTLRLSVQLIAANNEKHLWGEIFDQEIKQTKDIFEIQSQVAQAIASRLQATITPDEKRLIDKKATINLTAYDFYQRGQEEIDKHPWPEFNPEALKRAEVLFNKALEYDSTFALAYYGLAHIIWIKSDYTRNNNNAESSILKMYVDSMRILADIALSYDDHLEGPYIIRAAYYQINGNFKKTIEEYDKAIRINPNDSWAYEKKGWTYEGFDILKSIQNYQKAASLNHGSRLAGLLKTIGAQYFNAGFPEKGKYFFLEKLKLDGDSIWYSDDLIRYTSALEPDYKKAIEYFEKRHLTDSTNTLLFLDLGYFYTFSGNYKESLKYFKKYLLTIKASELSDDDMITKYIGYSYLQNGYVKEADYYFDMKSESFNLAAINACRGYRAKAYENLRIINNNPFVKLLMVTQLKTDPMFASIRNEPEFQKILKDVEAKYQALHESVGKWIEEQEQGL
jgi:TolB-like protein